MKGEAIPVDCEHLLQVLADLRGIEEAELVRTEPLLAEKGAAGFVRLTEENGELWAVVEKWAPRARELLSSAGDAIYNYFSPVIRGLRKPPLRVTSFALTNSPAINDLDALAAVGERTIGRTWPAAGRPPWTSIFGRGWGCPKRRVRCATG
jgi:phage I-like protein